MFVMLHWHISKTTIRLIRLAELGAVLCRLASIGDDDDLKWWFKYR